jgi:hypothetical protein
MMMNCWFNWTGGVVNHRVAKVRRSIERRPDRVPDQPGAVPAHTFPARGVCAGRLCGQGVFYGSKFM